MNLPRRRFLCLATAAAALPAVARTASAQAYPSRPITIVEPFAAGGPLDTIGRILAERMRVALGQPVIVENVAGASGTLGIARVARAAPDGYTIGHGSTPTHVLNGAVFKLPFDIVRRFPTDRGDRDRTAPDRRSGRPSPPMTSANSSPG